MIQKVQKREKRGFVLIVTVSLMILLTVIAVGLLSLSSLSLQSSAQGNAMATARPNAKLALMLAVGDLQKAAGPDKRITAPTNLVDATATPGVTLRNPYNVPLRVTGLQVAFSDIGSHLHRFPAMDDSLRARATVFSVC